MEKIFKYFKMRKYINWDDFNEVSIDKVLKDLQELKELGCTHIILESENQISINPLIYRKETDEEFQYRLKLETIREEAIKKQELQQLEILKKKYNQ